MLSSCQNASRLSAKKQHPQIELGTQDTLDFEHWEATISLTNGKEREDITVRH